MKMSKLIFAGMPLLISSLVAPEAHAADSWGIYVGGAVGRSQVEVHVPELGMENHHAWDSAFEISAGMRPVTWFAAEVSYIDLSNSGRRLFPRPVDPRVRGGAAVGILHLPVRRLDLFVEAGPARLREVVSGGPPIGGACAWRCSVPFFERARTDFGLASGVGAQVSFGAWAAQIKYQHFGSPGGGVDASVVGIQLSIP